MENSKLGNDPLPKTCANNENFISGVVEGFYGRPWTLDQRKDLFIKLREWGMNSYLYAPKDDYKHRAYWRELYSVEEAEQLSTLISACKEQNIIFYYALSPGLDITYSSAKDMALLKRKLEQIAQFGCTAFALLFDDIESEMSESDKEAFQSFAQAQVSVTNQIYQHLNQPKGFLFCPTQYCASRAIPDVKNSEYLNTIGTKLFPDIDIMWTGPKVISRIICPESIEELSEVIRRKPVIWDNLHANDYDQKRLFLGPYSGRPSSLLPKLKGVLTNPNCEYGANFVAVHTLAQWVLCTADSSSPDPLSNDAVSADIKLEQEVEGNAENDSGMPSHVYDKRRALKRAVALWMNEFRKPKSMWGPMTKPHPSCSGPPGPLTFSGNNSAAVLTPSSSTISLDSAVAPAASGGNAINSQSENSGFATNSISNIAEAEENASTSASMASLERIGECNVEPMETVETNSSVSPSSPQTKNIEVEDEEVEEKAVIKDEEIKDVVMGDSEKKDDDEDEEFGLTEEDVLLLCDLFYLPFEHGPQGMQLLEEFSWLKHHARLGANVPRKDPAKPEVQEWHNRAAKFDEMSQALNRLFTRLTYISNRELLYELYPYVWDMRGIVALLNSYVKWLACNHECKEGFLSGEQEPWVFRGGLASDLQRLLPLESANDLFLYKSPEVPSRMVYTIRPYLPADEAAVYQLARKLHIQRIAGLASDIENALAPFPDLVGDIQLGAFLTLSPELCFVVEDDNSPVGFAVAAANAKDFATKVKLAWLPEIRAKYSSLAQLETLPDSDTLVPAALKDLTASLQKIQNEPPAAVFSYHPAQLRIGLLDSVMDHSVAKRLVTCVVAALKAHGSTGCHVEVPQSDGATMEFYNRLGFMEIKNLHSCEGSQYFGRIF